MNKGRTPYVTLAIIIILTAFLFLGKISIANPEESGEGIIPPPLTLIEKGQSLGYYQNLGKDLIKFLREYNKTGAFKLHRDLKGNLKTDIENHKNRLQSLKEQEKKLKAELNNIPREEYIHNKLELSSFIVDRIANQSLPYEIVYNYEDEVQEETPIEGEVVQAGKYSNQFMIKIFQINHDDNYAKANKVLEEVFIKEPYEIIKTEVGFDSISESYYLMIVIQV